MNVVKAVQTRAVKGTRLFFASVLLVFAGATAAEATNNCVFVKSTKSWNLTASCSTDETLVIPTGITLNGGGFKITAIDPPAGNFVGAIIQNAGKTLNVNNLFLRTNLADVCAAPGNGVVGILLNKSASTISGVNITINKGAGTSTCAEGVAIQAQGLPFVANGAFSKVTVKGSTLNYNQLAGVVAYGNVNVRVEANLIKNLGGFPVAQRGVEIGLGAKSYILNNEIVRHTQVPQTSSPSYGILMNLAGQSTVLTNVLNFNDFGIRLIGTSKNTVRGNAIRSSAFDGILVSGFPGVVSTGNTLWANNSGKNIGNGITLSDLDGTVTKNTIKNNITERNDAAGLVVGGTLNKIQVNTSSLNDVIDIANIGTGGNLYSKNLCVTNSGPPVTCTPPPPPAP